MTTALRFAFTAILFHALLFTGLAQSKPPIPVKKKKPHLVNVQHNEPERKAKPSAEEPAGQPDLSQPVAIHLTLPPAKPDHSAWDGFVRGAVDATAALSLSLFPIFFRDSADSPPDPLVVLCKADGQIVRLGFTMNRFETTFRAAALPTGEPFGLAVLDADLKQHDFVDFLIVIPGGTKPSAWKDSIEEIKHSLARFIPRQDHALRLHPGSNQIPDEIPLIPQTALSNPMTFQSGLTLEMYNYDAEAHQLSRMPKSPRNRLR